MKGWSSGLCAGAGVPGGSARRGAGHHPVAPARWDFLPHRARLCRAHHPWLHCASGPGACLEGTAGQQAQVSSKNTLSGRHVKPLIAEALILLARSVSTP